MALIIGLTVGLKNTCKTECPTITEENLTEDIFESCLNLTCQNTTILKSKLLFKIFLNFNNNNNNRMLYELSFTLYNSHWKYNLHKNEIKIIKW